MANEIKEKIKKLENQRKRLIEKEKALKEKENKKIQKTYAKLGALAKKAKIPELDEKALLGAFLEIADKSDKEEHLTNWRKLADNHKSKKSNQQGTPLIVTFLKHPDKTTREELKALGLKWNRFRGEYYGYGSKEELSKKFGSENVKIEVVD